MGFHVMLQEVGSGSGAGAGTGAGGYIVWREDLLRDWEVRICHQYLGSATTQPHSTFLNATSSGREERYPRLIIVSGAHKERVFCKMRYEDAEVAEGYA
jgi:hypothetical protein